MQIKKLPAAKMERAEAAELIFLLGAGAVFIGAWLAFGIGYGFLLVGLLFVYLALKGA